MKRAATRTAISSAALVAASIRCCVSIARASPRSQCASSTTSPAAPSKKPNERLMVSILEKPNNNSRCAPAQSQSHSTAQPRPALPSPPSPSRTPSRPRPHWHGSPPALARQRSPPAPAQAQQQQVRRRSTVRSPRSELRATTATTRRAAPSGRAVTARRRRYARPPALAASASAGAAAAAQPSGRGTLRRYYDLSAAAAWRSCAVAAVPVGPVPPGVRGARRRRARPAVRAQPAQPEGGAPAAVLSPKRAAVARRGAGGRNERSRPKKASWWPARAGARVTRRR
jgi:hypothetical protein